MMTLEPTQRGILQDFADMLEYPQSDLAKIIHNCEKWIPVEFAEIPEIAELIHKFSKLVKNTSQERLEELYIGTFDFNTLNSLYLGYHLFGESYKRSAFMMGLKERYKMQNFSFGNKELPDYLPVVLRFLATTCEAELAHELIRDAILPVLTQITRIREDTDEEKALAPSISHKAYIAVLQALQLILQHLQTLHNMKTRRNEL